MASGKKPSGAGFLVGGIMILLSFVAGFGGPILGVVQLVSVFASYQEFPAGTTRVDLNAGDYWVLGADNFMVTTVEITNDQGAPIPLRDVTDSAWTGEVTTGGQTYTGFSQMTIPDSGTYTVRVLGSEFAGTGASSTVAIGPEPTSELSTFVLLTAGGIGAAVLLFIIGLIVLIVTGVRRGRWKRQNPPGGFGGGVPQQPYGSYPQPQPAQGGYQQPGYQQPAPGGYQQPAPGGYQQPGYQQPAPGGYQQPAPGGYQQPQQAPPGQAPPPQAPPAT